MNHVTAGVVFAGRSIEHSGGFQEGANRSFCSHDPVRVHFLKFRKSPPPCLLRPLANENCVAIWSEID